MATDLIQDLSPRELHRQIENASTNDSQPLPPSGKMFLAVAKIQGFDGLPKVVDRPTMDTHIFNGCIELNRGLVSTRSLPAIAYASQLLSGAMYPGTITVHGHGIYFGEPSVPCSPGMPFPTISQIATKYATERGSGGMIVRGALKPDAETMEIDELRERFRHARNRAHRTGITDVGVFAAASGIDAYFVDDAFLFSKERMWVVMNRRALVLQASAFQITQIENAEPQF